MVQATPAEIVWHRLTGTAPKKILLAPAWCNEKWSVLNAIEAELRRRRSPRQQVA
jgi:radical SAM superfamily enzyme